MYSYFVEIHIINVLITNSSYKIFQYILNKINNNVLVLCFLFVTVPCVCCSSFWCSFCLFVIYFFAWTSLGHYCQWLSSECSHCYPFVSAGVELREDTNSARSSVELPSVKMFCNYLARNLHLSH